MDGFRLIRSSCTLNSIHSLLQLNNSFERKVHKMKVSNYVERNFGFVLHSSTTWYLNYVHKECAMNKMQRMNAHTHTKVLHRLPLQLQIRDWKIQIHQCKKRHEKGTPTKPLSLYIYIYSEQNPFAKQRALTQLSSICVASCY